VAGINVPAVGDVAVAGDTALLRGYAAWFLHQMLERQPGGFEALLARSGVPLEKRENLLRARAALGHVGGIWRTSSSGTPGSAFAGADAYSLGGLSGSELSAKEAAGVLGITDRQTRSLAHVLGGRRDSGGRWWFDPARIELERERRMRGQAA
jgi:hypothetical protein